MAHDDVGAGKRARQIDHIGQLRKEHPRIQRQAERGKPRQARAEIGAAIDVRPRRAVADDRIGVPVAGMAHAAEPAAAGTDLRLQHRLDPLAQRQVGVAHDARGNARRPVAAAVAHRGNAGDEFRLADRTHFLRAGGAVHRVALQEHSGDHVVPGCAGPRAVRAAGNDDPDAAKGDDGYR